MHILVRFHQKNWSTFWIIYSMASFYFLVALIIILPVQLIYTTIKQMIINCKRTSKEFRLLTAWYINLNCFSNHQLQWKWFPALLPKITNYFFFKIITIYYGFSYWVRSKSCENTTSSNILFIISMNI